MIGRDAWPKHLLYLSAEKVEALHGQLTARQRRRVAQEVEVDLKLVRGRLSFEQAPENLYAKLRLVLGHLQREEAIGSVESPAQYVAGSLPMVWGSLGAADAGVTAEVVLFVADRSDCSFALGGSRHNIVGERVESLPRSGSNAFALLEALRAADPESKRDRLAVRMLRDHEGRPDDWELELIERTVSSFPGVTQEVEFVARRLIEGVSADGTRRVLLASPLYVALVD